MSKYDYPMICSKHGPRESVMEMECSACADEHLATERLAREKAEADLDMIRFIAGHFPKM